MPSDPDTHDLPAALERELRLLLAASSGDHTEALAALCDRWPQHAASIRLRADAIVQPEGMVREGREEHPRTVGSYRILEALERWNRGLCGERGSLFGRS